MSEIEFTWEDVDQLRAVARDAEDERESVWPWIDHPLFELQLWAEDLADRIAKKLPPREAP